MPPQWVPQQNPTSPTEIQMEGLRHCDHGLLRRECQTCHDQTCPDLRLPTSLTNLPTSMAVRDQEHHHQDTEVALEGRYPPFHSSPTLHEIHEILMPLKTNPPFQFLYTTTWMMTFSAPSPLISAKHDLAHLIATLTCQQIPKTHSLKEANITTSSNIMGQHPTAHRSDEVFDLPKCPRKKSRSSMAS